MTIVLSKSKYHVVPINKKKCVLNRKNRRSFSMTYLTSSRNSCQQITKVGFINVRIDLVKNQYNKK